MVHAQTAAHGEPHDAPWTMTVPLLALAGLSILGGIIDLPFVRSNFDFLDNWLAPILHDVPEIPASSFQVAFVLSTITLVVAIVGIVLGRAFYKRGLEADGTDPVAERLGPFAAVLANAYYLDVGLARFVSGPVMAFARFLNEGIDRDTVDGAVNGIAALCRRGGSGLRRIQTGLVRNYALGIVLGTVILLLYFTTRATL